MAKRGYWQVRDVILTAIILAAATLTGFWFSVWQLHETNVVVLYIFSVLLISRFTRGYACGIAASVLSLLLFNYFFTEPHFTLKVNDMTYIITFATMMFTSVMTGAITTKAKQAAADAQERERESNTLYRMTNHLTDAEDADAIARITVTATSEMLGCNTACICYDMQGLPERTFIQRRQDASLIRRELSERDELHLRAERFGSDVEAAGKYLLYPVCGKTMVLAVLRIPKAAGAQMSAAQARMLSSILESAALALDRLRSLQEQARSREEAARERCRGNLLRAISHDIRTPLSGIMGTSEVLMHTTQPDDLRFALANDIYRDAQWLHGMVENILNLTKLQEGRLSLNKQPEAVEEVIGAALMAMEKRLPGRVIDVEMPDDVVMVPMDARLISQVLINLLDNAVKHTAAEQAITVSVSAGEESVSITVADRGCGIAENDLSNVFKMFYTTGGRAADSRRGVGLGLSICQSIVEAHGGSIRAENRAGGGAEFTFTLPLEVGCDDIAK